MSKDKPAADETPAPRSPADLPGRLGDPDCPHCRGIGYISYDVPVGHPEFGRMHVCSCRQPEIEARAREKLFALSHLNRLENLTFEAFQPRGRIGIGPYQADSLERAFNQARQFAQSQDGWLVLQGGYGCGKTHLAAAITNESASLGVPALFLTVPDLLDQLRFAYSSTEETFEERFEAVRRAPLLVLDDFGTQNATEWAGEKLFQILNYRYTNKLPLVVTTNLPLDEVEPRLRSRLQDPELVTRVTIQSPDYRRPADDTGHHELSSLPHFAQLTFGNFEERGGEGLPADEVRSLAMAFKSARQFAESPHGWLILMGANGTGKTHLAAAIGNYRAGLGYPPLLVSIPDLLDELRATFAPENRSRYDRQFDSFKDVPLLLLDDLGRQSMTNWVREKLNQLFNHRHVRELPTVVTTADTLENLYKNEPYIASRMLDQRVARIYALTVPPYRGGKKKQ
ncbi:MAG TPA: ATP-binding protein [Anaerolineales bacterium]|nr:ATP-binding protein [Anaerolineales bacterium]